MTVSKRLEKLADALRREGFDAFAEEIDHVMLEGDLEAVPTLITVLDQFAGSYKPQ